MTNSKKKFYTDEVENILKKQKLVFAVWNCSSKEDDPYQMWYLPLKRLFGKAILFDPRKLRLLYGSEKMNELFFSLIKKEKPNYVFTNVRRDEQTIETMEKVKKISPNTKIIAFSGDDDKDFEPLKRYQALFVDCTFIAQPDYLERYYADGIKNAFNSFSINTDLFGQINLKKIYDVTFIGKPLKPRLETLRYLIKKNVGLKIFGRGWENYPEFKDFYGGQLKTSDMIEVINQSKINLSLLKNEYGALHFKGRVLMFPSCKAFSLTEYFNKCLEFFKNNKEIVMFKNNKELLEKIKYYLKHEKEREKIAEKAYKKIHDKHSVFKDFKEMFKRIIKNPRLFSAKLLDVNGKIITFTKKDMEKNSAEIKKLAEGFDYVAFSDGNSTSLKHKEYLQAYSLEKTKKQISCCDYHVYDQVLGNYLTSNVYKAFRTLKKSDFSKAVTINQIAVTKNYFLENINKFKSFFNESPINIFNKQNICLVSIPLVRIYKIKIKSPNLLASCFFHKNYLLNAYLLFKQKKIISASSRMMYLFLKKTRFLRASIKFFQDKKNWKLATHL